MKHYIIGTGSQAKYVIEIFKNKKIKLNGLVDIENKDNVGKKINGLEVLCVLEQISKKVSPESSELIIAYGNNKKKEEIVSKLEKLNYKFFNAISDNSYISDYVTIGEGVIINPNVTIMPNTKIGSHVILHSGCVIEHDNLISNFANLAPGVITAGYVKIGKCAFVYTGANIVPKKTVGDYAIVGAGALVLKDVEPNTVVVGVPAKVLEK